LTGVIFFALLFWMRRREQRAELESQRLKFELAETQHNLEKAQHRVQQLIGLLNALHEQRQSSTGRVSWIELADFKWQTDGRLVGTDTVVLLRWDNETSEYKGIASRGLSPEQMAALHVRSGEGVLGRAAQGGKVLSVHEPVGVAGVGPQESFLTAPFLVFPL